MRTCGLDVLISSSTGHCFDIERDLPHHFYCLKESTCVLLKLISVLKKIKIVFRICIRICFSKEDKQLLGNCWMCICGSGASFASHWCSLMSSLIWLYWTTISTKKNNLYLFYVYVENAHPGFINMNVYAIVEIYDMIAQ